MAEAGAVRFALAIADDPATLEAERARLLKKARAAGYQLRIRDGAAAKSAASDPVRDSAAPATPARAADDTAVDEADDNAAAKPKKESAAKARAKPARGSTLGQSLAAFVYSTIFFAAAVGAGYLAMHGAEELHARTGTVPVFGDRLELVFPSFVFALGVLPTLLVYRARAVVYALVAGGLAWFGGFAAWTRWPFVHARTMEALGAAIAGFLATLLVLGLAGDAKKQGPASRR